MAGTLTSKLLPIRPSNRGAEGLVEAILNATDEVLKSTALESFSLVAVARTAGIPNASIYHFFPSAEAVLVGLLRRYLGAMDALIEGELATAPRMTWQSLVRHLFEIVREFYAEQPVAATLVFHAGGFGGLQSVDDDHVAEIAIVCSSIFEARFHVPVIEEMHRRVAIAIAMSDRIWAMEVQDGRVSDFVFEESQRAIISYLSNFLPPVLACREVE